MTVNESRCMHCIHVMVLQLSCHTIVQVNDIAMWGKTHDEAVSNNGEIFI